MPSTRKPRRPGGSAPKMKADSSAAQLTPAEQDALDAELAEARRHTIRRLRILLLVLGVILYVWAAMVISAQNR